MATITTRNIKGSPLTFTQLDENFTNLNTAKYEENSNPTFNKTTTTTFRNISKTRVSSANLTNYILTSQNTYFTSILGTTCTIIFPEASTANLDGMIYTIMSTVGKTSGLVLQSTGATFVPNITALAANTPYRYQFHAETNQWFIC